uniref:Uncharacterized protein n=1 Tax=Arundo donax TaxID=35708 RepID=A0A0A9C1X2_ARUDO
MLLRESLAKGNEEAMLCHGAQPPPAPRVQFASNLQVDA